ncbi:MAG: hypothetical protein AAFS10_15170, partial [Myxococcota bacterium]
MDSSLCVLQRMLGRGGVQRRAIEQLSRLGDDEVVQKARDLLLRWRLIESHKPHPNQDEEFIMNTEQLYQQAFEAHNKRIADDAKAQGKAEGKIEGKVEGKLEGKIEVVAVLIAQRLGRELTS